MIEPVKTGDSRNPPRLSPAIAGLIMEFGFRTWGWRPRLYAVSRYRGL